MKEAKTKEEFLELLKNRGSDSYDEWFYSIANGLMNYFCLTVGKNEYRITECEIYFQNEEHFDPYVNGNAAQLTMGILFSNYSGGVDITFGSEINNAYGGILIREIRQIGVPKYIHGVQLVVSEIFKSLGNIISNEGRISLRKVDDGKFTYEIPMKKLRIGLKEKEKDNENFHGKFYRYGVEEIEKRNDTELQKRLMKIQKQ